MLRRPVAPLLIPLCLVIDGEESTVYLRPPNADDLAGLPSSVKTGLVGEVVSAPPPDEPVAVKPGKTGPEPLERVADAALRRFHADRCGAHRPGAPHRARRRSLRGARRPVASPSRR